MAKSTHPRAIELFEFLVADVAGGEKEMRSEGDWVVQGEGEIPGPEF